MITNRLCTKIIALLAIPSCLFLTQCKSVSVPKEKKVIITPLETWKPYVYVKPSDLGDTLKPYRPLETFNQDTTAYLKANFEERKGLYIGKPLDKLLNDLEVPIQKYRYTFSDKHRTLYTDFTLILHRGKLKKPNGDYQFNTIIMNIKWTKTLPISIADSIRDKHEGRWSEEAAKYYREQIMGDLGIF